MRSISSERKERLAIGPSLERLSLSREGFLRSDVAWAEARERLTILVIVGKELNTKTRLQQRSGNGIKFTQFIRSRCDEFGKFIGSSCTEVVEWRRLCTRVKMRRWSWNKVGKKVAVEIQNSIFWVTGKCAASEDNSIMYRDCVASCEYLLVLFYNVHTMLSFVWPNIIRASSRISN